ncbi:HIT domain-containing protein [Sphaerisporangium sp. NPDC051011]|uniref:HIT family protein n=1 Tax=Sphaerisporangium sp. NPDC051011 TaxID=3155792 RepID=UPI0033E5F20F
MTIRRRVIPSALLVLGVLGREGVNAFLADGKAAFQEVFHFHLHVFPRFEGDGFRIDANWGTRARSLLDQESKAVQSGLAALGFPPGDTSTTRDLPA